MDVSMKNEFIVRELHGGDFHSVRRNYLARFDEKERNPYTHIGLPERKPTLSEEMEWFSKTIRGVRDGTSIASVAEIGGRVVGQCTVSPLNFKKERSHIGFLGVSVLDEFRSMGLGKALIEDVFKRAKGTFETIVLEVFSTNPRARSLYERLGFNLYGVLEGGIKLDNEKIDIFLMRREC